MIRDAGALLWGMFFSRMPAKPANLRAPPFPAAFLFLSLIVGLCPRISLAQNAISTGTRAGFRMYYPGSNDWWLDPSAGRLDIRANGGAPLASLNGLGNLGIGTASPGYLLDVNGSARIGGTGGAFPNAGAGGLIVVAGGGGDAVIVSSAIGPNDNAFLACNATGIGACYVSSLNGKPLYLGVGLTSQDLSIDASHRVGIANASPGTYLTVGPATSASEQVISVPNNGGESLAIYKDANGPNYNVFNAASGYVLAVGSRGGSTAPGYKSGTFTGSVTMAYADATAKVGIGTTNPSSTLHVFNASGDTISVEKPSGAAISFRRSGTEQVLLQESGVGDFQIYTAPIWTERMRVTASGNVGIGTASPGQKLSVAGTVESTFGGFKFPDTTVQSTAFTGNSPTKGNLSLVQEINASGNTSAVFNGLSPNIKYVLRFRLTCNGASPLGEPGGQYLALRFNGDANPNYSDNFNTPASNGISYFDFTNSAAYIRLNFSPGGFGSDIQGEIFFQTQGFNNNRVEANFTTKYPNKGDSFFQVSMGGGWYRGISSLNSATVFLTSTPSTCQNFTGNLDLYSVVNEN